MSRYDEIAAVQDRIDAQTMLALVEQRKAYPKTYSAVRDAVAEYRAFNAERIYMERKHGKS